MPDFKDHFSSQSDIYLKYRPSYPEELFEFIATLTKEHQLAWDCGTGNGQAAVSLAHHYKKIIATDPSEQQLKYALQHPKIEYKVEKAESTSIASSSIDLVLIANAIHWFDLENFYNQVNRVLKKEGVIVALCYMLPHITPEIDKIIHDFHYGILDQYWLPENRLVEKGYQTIPFPFEPITSPGFVCEKMFSLEDLVGYLNTWSAVQRYISKNKTNPTDLIKESLAKAWPENKTLFITWNLTVKAGRKI